MHLSKPLIIISCLAAAIIVVSRKRRVRQRRQDLAAVRAAQVATQPRRSIYLGSLHEDEVVIFEDVDGYSWEIQIQRDSKCIDDRKISNMLVCSDSPLYLRYFRDRSHGNFAQLTMPRSLEAGEPFVLQAVGLQDLAFPAIKPGTLRKVPAASRQLV